MNWYLGLFFAVFFLVFPATAGETEFFVDGLSCPFCAHSIEKGFKSNPDVESVDISLSTGKVVVRTKSKKSLSRSEIEKTVVDAGFKLRKPAKGSRNTQSESENK